MSQFYERTLEDSEKYVIGIENKQTAALRKWSWQDGRNSVKESMQILALFVEYCADEKNPNEPKYVACPVGELMKRARLVKSQIVARGDWPLEEP